MAKLSLDSREAGAGPEKCLFVCFFKASMYSGGVYGRLKTFACARSTWLHQAGLVAGELPFVQSNRISEAQTQLHTLANDGCKDQFSVITKITFS